MHKQRSDKVVVINKQTKHDNFQLGSCRSEVGQSSPNHGVGGSFGVKVSVMSERIGRFSYGNKNEAL